MTELVEKLKSNKYIVNIIKIACSLYIIWVIGTSLFSDGLSPYYSYKDYDYKNDFVEEQSHLLGELTSISQKFEAKGNVLDNVELYFADNVTEELNISIVDEKGKIIIDTNINTSNYVDKAWNKLGINTSTLKRGKIYTITFSRESGLSDIVIDNGNAPIIFGDCISGGEQITGNVAVGFQFTYKYLTLGSVFEIVLKTLITLLMLMVITLAIFKIEEIIQVFINTEKKQGFGYALYFGVSLVLLYNPLDTFRNEMTEFSRVIGVGLIQNVDVSKRTSNFNHWFLLFAVVFAVYYLLANYWLQSDKSGECKKVQDFLGHFMILANCSLLLRCITYFNDETANTATYYFSSYILLIIAISAIMYIVLGLDKNVCTDTFAKLLVIAASASYPISIIISL